MCVVILATISVVGPKTIGAMHLLLWGSKGQGSYKPWILYYSQVTYGDALDKSATLAPTCYQFSTSLARVVPGQENASL